MKRNVIYLSEFGIGTGSGYGNIAQQLCLGLMQRGIGVLGLGTDYQGMEHDLPFAITPTPESLVPMLLSGLATAPDEQFHAVIVARDIPGHLRLQAHFSEGGSPLPYIGLYPIENGPLCDSWAMKLCSLDAALILSEFGTKLATEAGVNASYLPIGVDAEAWRPPSPEERTNLRENLGIEPDQFFVLTVADNQERKNLTAALEIIARTRNIMSAGNRLLYGLVTRPDSVYGYRLLDYAIEAGTMDILRMYKRGMSQKALWGLYAAADAFLLTSKAEGLGMPVLEAMSMNLPVVATDCAAIRDHLIDGRGYLVESQFQARDSWGNEWRHYIDVEAGSYQLRNALEEPSNGMQERALKYVRARTWDGAMDVVEEVLNNAFKD